MARKKGERHGGDGTRRESHATAEEHEGSRARGRDNGARRTAAAPPPGEHPEDVVAAAAAMPPPDSEAAAAAPSEAVQRAEQLVDEWAERLGHYAGVAGHQVLRVLARAREEAEDMWAEAQSIRRGEGGQQAPEEPAPVADTTSAQSGGPALQRADQMVDEVGDRVGKFAFNLGQQLRRLAARAREEAEDIWAEAQNIRQRQQPGPKEPPRG